MEEWKEVRMSDIIEDISMGPFGSDIKRECYVDDGVPYLNGSNVQGIKLGEKSFIYVSEEKAKSLKKSIAHRGDLIVTHRGTLGQIVYVPDDSKYNEYLISNSQFRITLKKEIVSPVFLAYYFHSREGQNKILANSSQVGVPALGRPTSTFRQITIKIPSLQKQSKIVSILKSLDDKIENNRKINENLEQQAQALFKSWFVDFEPFRDQPFFESELGMIPEGWRVGTLGEIATISKKSINPANKPDKLYSHYSLPAFDDNQYPQKQFGKDIKSNKFLFNEDSILLSKLNPTIKRVWYVDKLDDNPICSTEFLPIETINNAFIAFVYCCIKDELYYSKLLSGVTGATNSHQRLSPNDIVNLRIPINEKSIEDFNLIVLPMLTMINANIRDNLHLSHLRDTLLPKLMNGEIKIS